MFDLETAVRRHHKALIDHGFADAPGGVAVPRGDEAQDRSQALVLWDIEAAMLIILQVGYSYHVSAWSKGHSFV